MSSDRPWQPWPNETWHYSPTHEEVLAPLPEDWEPEDEIEDNLFVDRNYVVAYVNPIGADQKAAQHARGDLLALAPEMAEAILAYVELWQRVNPDHEPTAAGAMTDLLAMADKLREIGATDG